jgi:DNA-binding GntR family transcriptional regulator
MLEPIVDADGALRIDEQAIVDRITAAVMEQRLPHGTKLTETALCQVFGVGRLRVQRALLLLANQDIVVLYSHRGAFIASPGQDEARDVFEARHAIEPDIVRLAVERATDHDIAGLEEHLRLERIARAEPTRRDAIRLSGEFHVRLAEATRNRVLTRLTRELVARTSLIIGLFGGIGPASCPENEHAEILAAIKDKDAGRAISRIRDHLTHIEAGLDLNAGGDGQVDIRTVLAE